MDRGISMIIDMQWGSTGKGAMAAYVAKHEPIDLAITNASANAGHTAYHEGKKIVTRHLPMATVIQGCDAYLCAGAIIDPEILKKEIEEFGVGHLVHIHPHAAVIESEDVHYEQERGSQATDIASTQKGCGRALSRKINREALLAEHHPDLMRYVKAPPCLSDPENYSILYEVPQGFDLSLNHGYQYPYVTSRDVTPMSALSDLGIHWQYVANIIGVMRPWPIRVGNIIDTTGKEIGWSGPHYPDQLELKWDMFQGCDAEITTVTGRTRRVFSWSNEQFHKAMSICRPDALFVSHCDYFASAAAFLAWSNRVLAQGAPIYWWGVGPDKIVKTQEEVCEVLEEKASVN